jgi:hypothetical protein
MRIPTWSRRVVSAAAVLLAAGAALAAPQPADAQVDAAAARADLTPDDVKSLREVGKIAEDLAADCMESEELQAQAFAALRRVHEALGDWNRPGLEDWYLGLLTKVRTGRLQDITLKDGETAARGGRYHLGGAREFWAKVDALEVEIGKNFGGAGGKARKAFETRTEQLAKKRASSPNVKPILVSVHKVNMAYLLKPIPEPKPEKPAPPPKPVAPAKPTPKK